MDPSQPVKRGRGRPKGQKNPPTAKNVGRRYKNGDPPIQRRIHVNAGVFSIFSNRRLRIYAHSKGIIAIMSTVTTPSIPATPSPSVENLLTELAVPAETGEKEQLPQLSIAVVNILTSYISATPSDASIGAQTDNGTTQDKGLGDSSALEITQRSHDHDEGVSNISLMPTSLQMEASALDGRRDIDIELDSLVLSSNVQQKIGILVTVRSFYRQINTIYLVHPTTRNVWAPSKGRSTQDGKYLLQISIPENLIYYNSV
jgi:hypothetical protein